MDKENDKPVKPESQHPQKGAGSSGFRLLQNEGRMGIDPITQRVMLAASMRSMSGPLPLGSEFSLYEKTCPGAGNRLIVMAEKEQDGRLAENQWRLQLDEKLIKAHNWRAGFAQVIAGGLVVLSLHYSYDLAMHGHDAAGIALGTTTIVGILGAYLGEKLGKSTEKPKEEKPGS